MTPDIDREAIIRTVRAHIGAREPGLANARISLRRLDGPPSGPRFSADAERCRATLCPHGVSPEQAAAGRCHVHACPLRSSIRLLLDEQGAVLQEQRGDIHWS